MPVIAPALRPAASRALAITPALSLALALPLALSLPLALALPLALGGCGGLPRNATLYSTHQPEVSHSTLSLDLPATAEGLAPAQQQQLAAWFTAMDLRYGDRVTVADPLDRPTTHAAVADVASGFGIAQIGKAAAPAEAEGLAPGSLRVTLTRASATVPHCPDWSANAASNPRDGTSSNFGCAINGNLAAMVANPEDLLRGARTTGHTSAMSAEKAIAAWRLSPPTTPGTAKDSSTRQ